MPDTVLQPCISKASIRVMINFRIYFLSIKTIHKSNNGLIVALLKGMGGPLEVVDVLARKGYSQAG